MTGPEALSGPAYRAARDAYKWFKEQPERVLLREMRARKQQETPWLTYGERQRLLAALNDQEFFDAVIALSARQAPEALVQQVTRILDSNRRPEDALEYAELLKTLVFTWVTPGDAAAILAQKSEEGFLRLTNRVDELFSQLSSAVVASGDSEASVRHAQLMSALLARNAPVPFDLEVRFGGSATQQEKALPGLVRALEEWACVALVGAGGSGKSTLLRALGRELMADNYSVLFAGLKDLDAASRQAAEDGQLSLASFVQSRAMPIKPPLEALAAIARAEGKRIAWLVDGLNELSPKAGEHLVRLLQGQHPGPHAIVVTDRRDEPYSGAEWGVARLQELSSDSVRTMIDGRFGSGVFVGLVPAQRELLATPFFLELALQSTLPPTATTQFQAIDEFVRAGSPGTVVGLSDDDVRALGTIALRVYRSGGGLFMRQSELNVSAAGYDALRSSGTLFESDGEVEVRHQLLLDYFAAHALAPDHSAWTVGTFDAVSNQANAIDVLLFATRLLPDAEQTDSFLTQLHDWNWFATVRCLRAVGGDLPTVSRGIVLAISAMLAVKQFEVVAGSARRARAWTRLLDETFALPFSSAPGPEDVVRLLKQLTVPPGEQGGWWEPWLETFTGQPSNDGLILRLYNSNPLLAWAAANVLRGRSMSNQDEELLQALYRSALVDTSQLGASVRWRVVHAVAERRSSASVDLLFESLDRDPYMWVQYGAVRGLVEAAASDATAARSRIVAQLRSRLGVLQNEPATQLYWAAQHAGADAGWPEAIRPLLREAVDYAGTVTERARRQRKLNEFDIWVDSVTPGSRASGPPT